jgi:hypothetical protein
MFRRLRKGRQYRHRGKNLIAANKIKPEQWQISDAEAQAALQAKGYKIKQIKKINCLKYQICISFWDEKGNVCSSFFSYRIFETWQKETEKLICSCQTLQDLTKLNHIMQYEFAYYCYHTEVEIQLQAALENRLHVLNTTSPQAVLQVI